MLLLAMLDYRNAGTARDLMNQKDKTAAFEAFREHPQLMALVGEMMRAQRGVSPARADLAAEGMAYASAIADARPDEEDEG